MKLRWWKQEREARRVCPFCGKSMRIRKDDGLWMHVTYDRTISTGLEPINTRGALTCKGSGWGRHQK